MIDKLTTEIPTLWSGARVILSWKIFTTGIAVTSAIVENLNDAFVNHQNLSHEHHGELTGKI